VEHKTETVIKSMFMKIMKSKMKNLEQF